MKLEFDQERHEYKLNGIIVPSVTQAISAAGFNLYDSVPAPLMEAAQKFGTAYHRAVQLYEDDDLDMGSLSAPLVPFLGQWIKCKQENKIRVLKTEYRVGSKIYQAAGTMDILAIYQGERTVFDLKTYQGVRITEGIQTAGYKLLYNEMNPKAPIKRRFSIHVSGDKYRMEPHTNMGDELDFLACVRIAHRKGDKSWRQQ